MSYVVYQKTYIERLGEFIEDETNLCESDNVDNLLKLLRSKDIKTSKRTIYRAIKDKTPIKDKLDEFYVYKMKL